MKNVLTKFLPSRTTLSQSEAEDVVESLYRGVLQRKTDRAHLKQLAGAISRGRTIASVIDEFTGSEEFLLKLTTGLFVPPGHYYSPIVDRDEARSHFHRQEARHEEGRVRGITTDLESMRMEWRTLLPYLRTNPFPAQRSLSTRYAFDNPSYSWGDGSILHAMLRQYTPKRLIEIGSGWSSACAIDTIERYFPDQCAATFIDPFPSLLREMVGKTKVKTTTLETPVQSVPLEVFDCLEAGDFLFIDSTHVLKTGSDVCFELFEIFPRGQAGVFVHIHDMFWPFEYPKEWAVADNRSWNELYAVRAMLTDNPGWRIVFFNDYFGRLAREEIEATYPQFLNNPGGALWLERR